MRTRLQFSVLSLAARAQPRPARSCRQARVRAGGGNQVLWPHSQAYALASTAATQPGKLASLCSVGFQVPPWTSQHPYCRVSSSGLGFKGLRQRDLMRAGALPWAVGKRSNRDDT